MPNASQHFATASLAELADGLRDRRITAAQLTEAAIAAHERRGPALGAYREFDTERARKQAAAADAAFAAGFDLGPLQGIPVSVKDIYAVSGWRTFAGTPRELPAKWEAEGPVVAEVRRNLAVIIGKTHTVEFAFGGIGTNPHWGTPRNPWDEEAHRAPGGSSSGAGVSLWEGSALVALGTDTAGSVRIPASMTGTVGVKTTVGRWSREGVVPLCRTLDTPGLLARSVADAALAFAAIDPLVADPADRFLAACGLLRAEDLRVGVCDWFFQDCDPGVAEGVEAAIDELAKAGLRVERFDWPELVESAELFRTGGIAAAEFAAFISGEMAPFRATLDPNVAARFEKMEQIPAVEYLRRRWRLEELAAETEQRMAAVDFVLGPTVPITPPAIESVASGQSYHRANMAALRNTSPANLLSLCALSLPVALDKAGLPVGLQLIAPYGEDERLLAAGLAFERVLGTARQRLGVPPLCRD